MYKSRVERATDFMLKGLKRASAMRWMQIDLSLAVNYVPAANCLVRLVFYLSVMCMIRPGEELGSYSLLAMSLWLDRVVFRVLLHNLIFDSSALILAVFNANVYQTIRGFNPPSHMSFLGAVVNFLWGMCCLYMIIEPIHLKSGKTRFNPV